MLMRAERRVDQIELTSSRVQGQGGKWQELTLGPEPIYKAEVKLIKIIQKATWRAISAIEVPAEITQPPKIKKKKKRKL